MFPRIRGTFLGVPIIGIIIYWGLYWGPLILGNYHIGLYRDKGLGFWGVIATMENQMDKENGNGVETGGKGRGMFQ